MNNTILIKGIIEEDFTNYKKPSMFIWFPQCSFKCEKECGIKCCQNSGLAQSTTIAIDINKLIDRYLENNLTEALVIGGLEPFDSWDYLYKFINSFRKLSNDDIVIYTGYYKNEIQDKLNYIKTHKNIIIKYGRFIPNQKLHYDEILGVNLSSDNQYAEILH